MSVDDIANEIIQLINNLSFGDQLKVIENVKLRLIKEKQKQK